MRPLKCPCCREYMQAITISPGGTYLKCASKLDGELVSLQFLKAFSGAAQFVQNLIEMRKIKITPANRKYLRCSNCQNLMEPTRISPTSELIIDQCFRCDLVWFDSGELNAASEKGDLNQHFPSLRQGDFHIPAKKKSKWPSQLPQSLIQIDSVGEQSSLNIRGYLHQTLEGVQINTRSNIMPAVSMCLTLLCLMATAAATRQPGLYVKWAFDPHHPWNLVRHFTSLLLHANLYHLLGNLPFLYLTGVHVEERKGPLALFLIFFMSGIGGNLIYKFMGFQTPTIGASGAVCGVMAYYALVFANHRISILTSYRTGWFKRDYFQASVSAPFYFMLYFAAQFIFAIVSQNDGAGINYWAHIGGAFTGLIIFHLGLFEDEKSQPV